MNFESVTTKDILVVSHIASLTDADTFNAAQGLEYEAVSSGYI